MTFKEQEQVTKKYSDELLSEPINYQGEYLMEEIILTGLQQLMELDRDEHIGASSFGSLHEGKEAVSKVRQPLLRQRYADIPVINPRE